MSIQRGAWKPLLNGRTRADALTAIDAIADILLKPLPALAFKGDSDSDRATMDVSLGGGKAGFAILYGYLARSRRSDFDYQMAADYLQQALSAVETMPMSASLYRGFTGIAWATAHLSKHLFDDEEADPIDVIDELLNDYLDQSPLPADYDLVNGLVGIGVYALERLPMPAAVRCLDLVVERLVELSQPCSSGITWPTPLDHRPHWLERGFGDGVYDLGVAHGVPGIISFLGEVCAIGVCREKALPLLQGAVNWLLRQNLKNRTGLSFPPYVAPNREPNAARSAWCYGDIGISLALLRAARGAEELALEHAALNLALSFMDRMYEESGIVDAGLCHGAFGVGHLLNRLFQASGDKRFGEAARLWFQQGLSMKLDDQGLAGFSTKMTEYDGETKWVKDPGFLTGVTGIALSLLAATTDIEPMWDRIMLVSVPPLNHG